MRQKQWILLKALLNIRTEFNLLKYVFTWREHIVKGIHGTYIDIRYGF